MYPGSEESVGFWSGIWDQPVTHNNTNWLKKVEEQLSGGRKHLQLVLKE